MSKVAGNVELVSPCISDYYNFQFDKVVYTLETIAVDLSLIVFLLFVA